MIGEHAVSPALKLSLASRLASLFKEVDVNDQNWVSGAQFQSLDRFELKFVDEVGYEVSP